MRNLFLTFLLALLLSKTNAQPRYLVSDEFGRNMIPRGFVVITEDKMGKVQFTADDYKRMVRMGANFQVIRLNLAKLGGWEGYQFDDSYIQYVDSLVAMGRESGMKTGFKMVIYGIPGFNVVGWGKLWNNKNGEQERWISAWKHIWERYKDEPSVYDYDLLNEPRKGDLDADYDIVEKDYLVPFLRKMVDESQKINPDKKCLYQPLLVNDEDREKYPVPFWEMKTPMDRKDIVYAPHIYEYTIQRIKPTVERYIREAEISKAGLFIGEWGPATYMKNDTSLTDQHNLEDIYRATANVFDKLGVGTIKAWFYGSRTQNKDLPDSYTWAVFKDDKPAGVVERKYITDVISRPYPQTLAGIINGFSFDYSSRILSMEFIPDNSKGASTIYIPADRYYPDGFSIHINDNLVLSYNPYKNNGLEVTRSPKDYNPADVIWDIFNQHLVILKWPGNKLRSNFKVVPGF